MNKVPPTTLCALKGINYVFQIDVVKKQTRDLQERARKLHKILGM